MIRALPLILLAAALTAGCKKDEIVTEPGYTSAIHGSVNLYDQNAEHESSNAGAVVRLEGTTDSVVTTASGSFVLRTYHTGSYALRISKPGYGYTKYPDVHLTTAWDDVIPLPVTLVRAPDYAIENLTVDHSDPSTAMVSARTTDVTPARSRALLLYLGKSPPRSDEPASWRLYQLLWQGASTDQFQCFISDSSIMEKAGFFSRDTVYVALYPLSMMLGGFSDPLTDKEMITSGIGPVPARASYVIP